jgi:hypothetical protein
MNIFFWNCLDFVSSLFGDKLNCRALISAPMFCRGEATTRRCCDMPQATASSAKEQETPAQCLESWTTRIQSSGAADHACTKGAMLARLREVRDSQDSRLRLYMVAVQSFLRIPVLEQHMPRLHALLPRLPHTYVVLWDDTDAQAPTRCSFGLVRADACERVRAGAKINMLTRLIRTFVVSGQCVASPDLLHGSQAWSTPQAFAWTQVGREEAGRILAVFERNRIDTLTPNTGQTRHHATSPLESLL